MSAFTSTTRTIGRGYANALFGKELAAELAQGFRNGFTIARSVPKAEFAGARVTLLGDSFRVALRPVGKLVGESFFTTLVAMELVDYIESRVDNRRRESEMRRLIDKLAIPGLDNEQRESIREDLKRCQLPPRRTFGQFVRDLAPRTLRRVWRAVVFEAGFWYTALTLPLWLTTIAAHGLYSFGVVLPISILADVMFNKDIDTTRWTERPGRVTRAIVDKTVGKGWRLMTKATRMTIHNRSAMYASGAGEYVLNTTKDKVFEDLRAEEDEFKIRDSASAREFGKLMADEVMHATALGDVTIDQTMKQSALAVFSTWSTENIAGVFMDDVREGFRGAVPLYLRDLVV